MIRTAPSITDRPEADAEQWTSSVPLDGRWSLVADPEGIGVEQAWPRQWPEATYDTVVPSALQETLPGLHGIAWYRRDFVAPPHRYGGGRYLLRFAAADHAARVWLNGTVLGEHEGGETPFVVDGTDAVRPGEVNELTVRIVNPTPAGVDGLHLEETAHRNRRMPFDAGASWNLGGLMGSVELLLVPRVWVADLFVQATPNNPDVRIEADLRNDSAHAVDADVSVSIAPAAEGHRLGTVTMRVSVPEHTCVTVSTTVPVSNLQLWQLEHPVLYRASIAVDLGPDGVDEVSRRFGVRDFRFTDGAFRLNDRPLFLRMTHTVNDYPLTGHPELTRDLLRRDLIHLKMLGFNMVRFIWGGSTPEQLDLCDELGLMVYAESFAAWPITASQRLAERFASAVEQLVRRDRNHPSLVIWGLLNESDDLPAFQAAVDYLPRLQQLDGSRMAALNSGRFERRPELASFANPGSTRWDVPLGAEASGAVAGPGHSWPPTDAQPMGTGSGPGDIHVYPRVPHTTSTIRQLRQLGAGDPNPVFLSEYGVGSAVDLWRVLRQYEEQGAADSEDASFYRQQLDGFLADWHRWRLDEVFGHPSRFFTESLSRNGAERAWGIDAVRANPNMVGYGLTGAVDQVMCGEGLATTFRELKPGTADALTAALAPARWCVFASAEVTYVHRSVRFEVVLADDGQRSGEELPVLAQLLGPGGREIWRHECTLTRPARPDGAAPGPLPVLDEQVLLSGPSGRYTFRVGFERGAAPTGGSVDVLTVDAVAPFERSCLFVGDPPPAAADLLGPGSTAWDREPVGAGAPLIWWESDPDDDLVAAGRQFLSDGGTVVCMNASSYGRLAGAARDLAPGEAGRASTLPSWLYLRDDWGRNHPIFEGLPSGGLLDYSSYRDIISDDVFYPAADAPVTAVAGTIKASQGYDSALTVWEQSVGDGLLVGCTFRIGDLVGAHPVADRLLLNLVRYAAGPIGS